ncbi:cation-transporting P-type ATPase [bacterium]|nr:cation-transporting P-type ATPase [bacterium]
MEPTAQPWHPLRPEEAARLLDVKPECGLDPAEAAARLSRFGPNALPRLEPPSLLALALRQVVNFIVLLLLAAAVISWLLGERGDALALLAAVLLNAVVGFVMDYQAEREIASIQGLTAPKARVRRGGNVLELDSEVLVPGDVVLLEAGDRIPADGRILAGAFSVDESLLTGESAPVTKHSEPLPGEALPLSSRRNEAFAGTLVTIGSATLLITATGPRSEVGKIGRLLSETERPAIPLTARLEALGRYLVWTVAAVAGVIVLLGLWQQQPFWPLLETSVVLAIAAIPEGLPTVATLALAAGAGRLAKKGLRLRQIGALEALGSVTTLCLDKTGTLTANAMTVQEIRLDGHVLGVIGEGWEPRGSFVESGASAPLTPRLQDLLRAVQRCNDATLEAHDGGWHIHGDPSEGALLVAAAKTGLRDDRAEAKRLATIPAGRDHPWMLVVYPEDGGIALFVKGAPEQVLSRCLTIRTETGSRALDEADRKAWLQANRAMADRALRVFGVATGRRGSDWREQPLEEGWEWLGLVGMADPARPGVDEALAQAHRAGIRTVMITGDQPATALAIARKLDMAAGQEPRVVVGAQAPEPDATVYARATPEGKYALVQALQASGQLVVMTGDGVNDAPALRAAAVGVAMGQGTDVARDAATAILVDERIETLLEGVREGRGAFLNIQKAVDFLLTCSITTMLAVLLTTAAGYPLPLLPLQILYLNILTHSFPALGLAMEPASAGVMARPPLPRKALLLPPERLGSILWHGVVMASATLAMGAWGWMHGGAAHGRTLVFATLATSLMLHTFADRSPKPFVGWVRGLRWPLLSFVGGAIALQLLALGWAPLRDLLQMTPLAPDDWVGGLVAATSTAVAVEVSKWAFPPDRAR